jgi:hypothetical protein
LVDARPGSHITSVAFAIELEREEDGRWIAEVPLCPACCATGWIVMKRRLASKHLHSV